MKERNKDLRITFFFFGIYLIFWLYITIFNRLSTAHFIFEEGVFEYYTKWYVNLIPLKSILYMVRNFEIFDILINILGNFFLFMPFGYFLPTLFKKQNKVSHYLFTIFNLIFLIEFCQFFLTIGSFDIDDFLLNFFGAYIGFKCLERKKIFKILIIFCIWVLLIALLKQEKTIEQNTFQFLDLSKNCVGEMEKIYEDDYYEYFFPCPKSDVYYIQIGNERRLLKDFLNEDIVQISTLIDSGLDCIKKAKYESIKIKKEGYYISEVKIENEEVLKVENPIYYRENHNIFEFFLIPLQEGTTKITIRFILSGSGDLEEERIYEVKVDKNLKVSLESQEDFE